MGHHLVEIFGCDVSILVGVGLLEDLVHFFVGEMFSQLGSHILELISVDFSLTHRKDTFLS